MKRTIQNPVVKDQVTFIRTSEETEGAITRLEIEVMPGGKNPPHYHRSYDEKFTVIEGKLSLGLSKGVHLDLLPGETYVIKAGQVHRFENTTNTAVRFINEITPGHKGFEDSLRIMYGLASDGFYNNKRQMPCSFQYLAVCAVMSDTRLPGMLSIVNLAFGIVARVAKLRGVEGELRKKYCI